MSYYHLETTLFFVLPYLTVNNSTSRGHHPIVTTATTARDLPLASEHTVHNDVRPRCALAVQNLEHPMSTSLP